MLKTVRHAPTVKPSQTQSYQIRRAIREDALGIHQIHMRSIWQLCNTRYTKEQLEAWGNRPFQEDVWHQSILKDAIWVIDHHGRIEGFGQLVNQGNRLGEI